MDKDFLIVLAITFFLVGLTCIGFSFHLGGLFFTFLFPSGIILIIGSLSIAYNLNKMPVSKKNYPS